jgi:uncharacterized protein (TIGR02147 family)
MDIFAISNYRDIIRQYVKSNKNERGYQKILAKAAGCQPSYLSQVLNSHVHLTPDQGGGFCDFWGFDEDETDYFINLILLERSSSGYLKRNLERKISELREKKLNFSERFKKMENALETMETNVLVEYCSSWYWVAVHVLLTIPGYQSPEKIASHLGMSEGFVKKCLERLVEMNIIAKTEDGWQPLKENLHIPKESPLLISYHTTWRQQALRRIQNYEKDDVHYTAVHSLSVKDYEKLRNKIIDLIDESRHIVVPSKEEMLVCFLCDFFPVKF